MKKPSRKKRNLYCQTFHRVFLHFNPINANNCFSHCTCDCFREFVTDGAVLSCRVVEGLHVSAVSSTNDQVPRLTYQQQQNILLGNHVLYLQKVIIKISRKTHKNDFILIDKYLMHNWIHVKKKMLNQRGLTSYLPFGLNLLYLLQKVGIIKTFRLSPSKERNPYALVTLHSKIGQSTYSSLDDLLNQEQS